MFVAVDTLVLALRALSFVAIFQTAGNAMFLELFRTALSPSAEQRIRLHARIAALAALLLTVFHFVLAPARMAGSLDGAFDPALGALQLESNAGLASIARVVGLAVLLLSLDRASRINSLATRGAIVLTLASFVLMGHTAIHPLRWALAPLLLAHVVAAAFWFGALSPLLVVAKTDEVQAVVSRFSRTAIRGVPVLFVCGVLLAVLLIRSRAELATPYGALVVAKAVVFGALLGLASLNKWRYAPRLGGGDSRAARSFERTVAAEWALLAIVFAGTALLTALFAPEHLEGSFGPGHRMEAEGTGDSPSSPAPQE